MIGWMNESIHSNEYVKKLVNIYVFFMNDLTIKLLNEWMFELMKLMIMFIVHLVILQNSFILQIIANFWLMNVRKIFPKSLIEFDFLTFRNVNFYWLIGKYQSLENFQESKKFRTLKIVYKSSIQKTFDKVIWKWRKSDLKKKKVYKIWKFYEKLNVVWKCLQNHKNQENLCHKSFFFYKPNSY